VIIKEVWYATMFTWDHGRCNRFIIYQERTKECIADSKEDRNYFSFTDPQSTQRHPNFYNEKMCATKEWYKILSSCSDASNYFW
jgi:hypothetical protein